jgi:hypothetical protein
MIFVISMVTIACNEIAREVGRKKLIRVTFIYI